jgi:prepilin-type N-terminal cleavage/methylation domain-containing protein
MTSRGFTLIELLVVVAVIGILATLGLPRLQVTRERAVAASMVSDLRNLTVAEENFFAAYQDYAKAIGGAEVPGPGGKGVVQFSPSSGNIIAITRRGPNAGNGSGWSATATNPAVTNTRFDVCGVFVGAKNYAPNKAVTVEGGVACY